VTADAFLSIINKGKKSTEKEEIKTSTVRSLTPHETINFYYISVYLLYLRLFR
jgi:hypothetical protein